MITWCFGSCSEKVAAVAYPAKPMPAIKNAIVTGAQRRFLAAVKISPDSLVHRRAASITGASAVGTCPARDAEKPG